MKPLIAQKSAPLQGTVTVAGDKSVSHRALMLASQAIGTSSIHGLLLGEDVLHTADALRALGVVITTDAHGVWHVEGVGVGGLREADNVIDMGNSGTAVRLMMGLVASYSFTTFFTGDKSLRSRPMARVTQPLAMMGAQFVAREKGRLPLVVMGTDALLPIRYSLPVPSAQVKSAILLAGLNTVGNTTVIETEATRDHTERMLSYFGAEVVVTHTEEGKEITLKGHPSLIANSIYVPGDPSSAAFLVVAALITAGSELVIENVCVNPLRIGLYQTLQEMGGDITFLNLRQVAGEEIADIRVRASRLHGVEVPASRAPSMIDEYPILSVAAAYAQGRTTMYGLAELKAKESNRLSAVAQGLNVCGVEYVEGEDSLIVEGGDGIVPGGGTVATSMDHRIAMAFLVLGGVASQPIVVDDGSMIATSFPQFTTLMNSIGAALRDGVPA